MLIRQECVRLYSGQVEFEWPVEYPPGSSVLVSEEKGTPKILDSRMAKMVIFKPWKKTKKLKRRGEES